MENLSVVVPFFNGHRTIGRLLDSLPDGLSVIIIDDLSDEPLHLNNRNVEIYRLDEKGYFAGAVNEGLFQCETDVLVLNQDVWFEGEAWLDFIAENKDRYALMGDGVFGHPAWPKGYVQGTFMFMRRDAIEKVGDLDAENYPLWGGTCEWQLRACRMGFEALPVKPVPGMRHERDEDKGRHFGSAISELLSRHPGEKGRFIRTPPMISVISPCYNHGRYITDLVNSLIGGETSLGVLQPQTFQSFELIIVNDASTDDTWEYLQNVENPWKGIRVIHHEVNKGTAAANNTGAKNARGKFLMFISADDMMDRDRLRRMYESSLENEGMVIYDDMRIFGDGKLGKSWRMKTYDFEVLLMKNHIHAGLFIPKKAWEDVGGYPEVMDKGREDWAFNVALGIKGWCGHHLSNYGGYLYRREGQNRTLRNTNPYDRAKFLDQMIGLFPTIYAGERPMGCCPGRRNQLKPSKSRRIDPMALPGSQGMVLIEYIGGKAGAMSFWVGNHRYVFGGNRKVGYVDAEDAVELVSMIENRRPMFRYYEAPKPKKVVKRDVEVKEMPPTMVVEAPEAVPVDVDEVEIESKVDDPVDMTISEVKKYVVGLPTVADMEAFLEAEMNGKHRIGAVMAIKAAIADVG